jgi:hypothetical protein
VFGGKTMPSRGASGFLVWDPGRAPLRAYRGGHGENGTGSAEIDRPFNRIRVNKIWDRHPRTGSFEVGTWEKGTDVARQEQIARGRSTNLSKGSSGGIRSRVKNA